MENHSNCEEVANVINEAIMEYDERQKHHICVSLAFFIYTGLISKGFEISKPVEKNKKV